MTEPTLGTFNQFFQLTKVDVNKREVWGRAVREEPDRAREILDYDSSKPLFQAWSEATRSRTSVLGKQGESLGALRAMHQPIAAGKIIDMQFNDADKAIDIGTYVADDAEWNKVLKGVYTGFSVGGAYAKRWLDPRQSNLTRYTADPAEISLVDTPCISSATFTMVKANGAAELRKIGEPMPAPLDASDLNPAPDEGGPLVGTNLQIDPLPDALPEVKTGEVVRAVPAPAGALSPDLIDATRAVEPVDIARPDITPTGIPAALDADMMKAFVDAVNTLAAMRKADEEDRTKTEDRLKALGSRVGVSRREGEPLTPPKDYPASAEDYGDPANHKWPLDSEARIQSAMAYFNGGKGTEAYTPSELAVVGRRIAARASTAFGTRYTYSPKDRTVSAASAASEVEKTTMSELKLKKAELGELLNQLAAAYDVGVDQIAADPEAALAGVLAALRTQSATRPVNTATAMPEGPMGSQERVTETSLTNAEGMTTPGSMPSSEMEKMAAQISALTDAVTKLVNGPSAPVAKALPAGDLAGLVQTLTQDAPADPVIKAYLDAVDTGNGNPLLKAAQAAGSNEMPDFQLAQEKIRTYATNSITPTFTNLMLRKALNGNAPLYTPTVPAQ